MRTRTWMNKDALVTSFDGYVNELKAVIDERLKFTKRAEGKPMATIEDPDNPHTTNRGEHMRQAAIEALKIAQGLGLNETVTYIGMLIHDAGQPFGAHAGERTMSIIGEILCTGFFHHNAKGVDVALSEDIIQKFIDAVPEAKNDEKLQQKLKDEAWYFLEIIVGHDGESTSKDNAKYSKSDKKYKNIKEAILDKVAKANRTDQYKCSVETLEAQISKPADILAYLKSDILTGFSKGILKDLSDDYLEILGKLMCETKEETEEIDSKKSQENSEEIRNTRINKAKKLITTIKKEKLRETKNDIYAEGSQEVLKQLDIIIRELESNGIELSDTDEFDQNLKNQIIEKIKKEFKDTKIKEGQNPNVVISQINKLDDYIKKMELTRKRVVEELMTKMQDALRNDYIETTLDNWKELDKREDLTDEERYKLKKQGMKFSDKVNNIIYGKNGIKEINYREYVQYSRKVYQTNSLPKGVFKLVNNCSESLVKTGLIRNKFYDPDVINKIENKEILKLMHKQDIEEEKNNQYKKEIGIIREEKSRIKKVRELMSTRLYSKRSLRKIRENKLYRQIYRHAQGQEERFARTCEDVYFAIPYTVRSMVEKAVRADYKENQYLPEEEKAKVYEIRKELAKNFGEYGGIAITKDNLENYINERIEKERNQLEYKVATQICIDYIAGKTNEGIKDLISKLGIVSKKELDREDKLNEEGDRVVQALAKSLSGDGTTKRETKREFKNRMKEARKATPMLVIEKEGDLEK